MHNVLTWDRETPEDFRAAAKKNILDYYTTIEFEKANIVTLQDVERASQRVITATSKDGRVFHGRKVILANGVQDVFPDIPGYEECFAKAM